MHRFNKFNESIVFPFERCKLQKIGFRISAILSPLTSANTSGHRNCRRSYSWQARFKLIPTFCRKSFFFACMACNLAYLNEFFCQCFHCCTEFHSLFTKALCHVCVCVCVREWMRAKEREREREPSMRVRESRQRLALICKQRAGRVVHLNKIQIIIESKSLEWI